MDVSGECKAYFFQISVLMGEPYFSTSLLPWHSLFFWYCRTALAGLLRPNATILPSSATLHMMAVEFQVIQIFVTCKCVFVLVWYIKNVCKQTGQSLYGVLFWLDKVSWGCPFSFTAWAWETCYWSNTQLNSDYCWNIELFNTYSSLNAELRMARFTFKLI